MLSDTTGRDYAAPLTKVNMPRPNWFKQKIWKGWHSGKISADAITPL
jgi:hypothetical protein